MVEKPREFRYRIRTELGRLPEMAVQPGMMPSQFDYGALEQGQFLNAHTYNAVRSACDWVQEG